MASQIGCLLILTGLAGGHSITTNSKVTGMVGGPVSVPCSYVDKYKNHVKYLCRGYYWNSCSYSFKSNQNSPKFSISDDKEQKVFTVTIKDLTPTDADYYWCNVEINNGADDGVRFQLSVTASNEKHSPALEKFLIPLSLLIFILIVTLVTWFLLKRLKQAKAESVAATNEEEITYSTVTVTTNTTRQIQSDADSAVTYSSVVIPSKTNG
ncbi:CMRF35-like molecule 1 [Cheilinus undulatus]|uniref:CMRF35-like molecule 1 n=1 Tax=Cheilinus undulatus TaxID=241271 RepID=UPI001BD61058|nr:CMRF35-like molecule 1 [Cheilinus undulatus]